MIVQRNWQTAVVGLLGVALSALVLSGSTPAAEKLYGGMFIVLYVVGGIASCVALAACLFLSYQYALRCGDRKVIRNSVLESYAKTIEDERSARERLEAKTEYTASMLLAQGIKVDAFLPLDDVKQRYAGALEAYQASGGRDAGALGEVERWDRVLGAHPDLRAEQRAEAAAWRRQELPRCKEALTTMRTFVPIGVQV